MGSLVTSTPAKTRALSEMPGRRRIQRLFRQVRQVQVNMVLVRPNPAPFADFNRHAARHHVARGQILVGRRVAFHEPLAFGIRQVAAFAARAFGNQAARAENAGRVELHEFHVLQRQARARDHAVAVAGAGMRACRAEIGASIAAGGQHDHLGVEQVQRAVIQLPGQHALALAVIRHDKVGGEILDEELGLFFTDWP